MSKQPTCGKCGREVEVTGKQLEDAATLVKELFPATPKDMVEARALTYLRCPLCMSHKSRGTTPSGLIIP